ncbi:hypothetical protein HO133_007537 [Letharia lupina]|uniref:UCH catalytic domain-containing protein n=1 Tax=Letharia lupina TaxID=560253 RepID=A0A8H6FIZ2_9LECA|nr:uncharacterized protein HO133_007537 [Letharia lupina]KAF6229421.1 hypothetical protein HO133_007537 [Letharia lupina]
MGKKAREDYVGPAYRTAALQGESDVPENAEDEVNIRYVCFVKSSKTGHLYELDGDRKGPVDHGILELGEVTIAFMVPNIQTSVVGTEHISVSSAQDAMIVTFLGFQVTPQNLDALTTSSAMDNIIPSTITGKLSEKQPYLWSFD